MQNMNLHIRSLSTFVLLSLLLLPACEKFEEFNQNPNEPTEVSADVLFTSAIRSSLNTMVTESFLLGNNAAQLTAKTLRKSTPITGTPSRPSGKACTKA